MTPPGHQQRLGRAGDEPLLVVHLGGGQAHRAGAEGGLGARQTHSPTGGRTRCTVSSVFMKLHWAGSRAAEAPEAESTQLSSRCSGVSSSPGTSGSSGRIQTTAGPGRVTAPSIHCHSTESR